jgi:DNA-binding response OmpR family regulator
MPIADRLRHVLVIEDNSADAFLIKKAVEDNGIQAGITLCTDGESAMRLIDSMGSANVPDAMIVDLSLPRIGGLDIVRKVWTRPAFVDVPVMVFTSSPSPADRNRVVLLHGVRYIQKPSGVDTFLHTVAQHVREMLGAPERRFSQCGHGN